MTADDKEEDKALIILEKSLTLSPEEEKLFKEFLSWFEENLCENKTSCLQKFAEIMGYLLASFANYPAISLGYAFGKLVARDLVALYIFFSIIAYTPSYILYSTAAIAGFTEVLRPFSPHAKLYKKTDFPWARGCLAIFKYLLAPFAGIPFMAYTMASLNNDLGTVIVFILFCASFVATLRAESMILNGFLMMAEPASLQGTRKTLNARLAQRKKYITEQSDEELAHLSRLLMSPLSATAPEFSMQVENKMVTLLELPKSNQQLSAPTTTRKTLPNCCGLTIEILAVVMAGIGMYPLEAGAKMAAEWFCTFTGIPEEHKESIKMSVAILSVFVNGLFCGFYAKNKFRLTSEAFWNKEFCPTVESLVALAFSMAASTMNAAIAEQSGNNRAFTFFSFIMATSMRLLAFEAFIKKGKRAYHNYRFPQAATTIKQNLLHLFDRLSTELSVMDATYVTAFEKATRMPLIGTNRSTMFAGSRNMELQNPKVSLQMVV